MTLADKLAAAKNPRRGPRCSVSILLDKLTETDPEGRAALEASIDTPDLAASAIVKALQEAGHHEVRTEAIRRHRRRGAPDGCACA